MNIDFKTFFMIYALEMRWSVPKFHIEVCEFLEDYGNLGLLMLPRGHGKSTILEIYNAYKIYKNPQELMMHQGATNSDAYKISRGTIAVLEKHPLTKDDCTQDRGTVTRWWVAACEDQKHGNIHAKGILSNVTGARATIIVNDDTETPSTTATQELRDKLAYRLSEQTHILIPGGSRLFVGTPHSHDSLYTKIQDMGATCFIRPMYSKHIRLEGVVKNKVYRVGFDTLDVFSGIGTNSHIPKYISINGYIIFKDNHALIDIYSEALWEERFTNNVMLQRRKECLSLNEWDSQYMLNSKPLGDSPLDINLFKEYSSELEIHVANRTKVAHINSKQIISVSACWDPSSGKKGRDISALSVVFKDVTGKSYWHDAIALLGELAITEDNGRIKGGQVWDVVSVIIKYQIPNIQIETNGIGGHIPSILKACLKTRGVSCAVTEVHNTGNKNNRIMNIQALLLSNSLYIHKRVRENPEIIKQINNYNPNTTKNKDDYLDSLAQCILSSHTTIGHIDIHNETKEVTRYYQQTKAVVASGW